MSVDDKYEILTWPPDFSDGNSSKWPGAGSSLVRADTSPTAQNWLYKTGQAIATVLGREAPGQYSMNAWPSGYAIFIQTRPDSDRADYYLYGGPKKYRSTVEFQEHAIWLYFSGNPPSGYETLLKSPTKRARVSSSKATTVVPKEQPKASAPSVARAQSTPKGPPLPEGSSTKSSLGKTVTFQDPIPPVAGPSTSTPLRTTERVKSSTEPATLATKWWRRSPRYLPPFLLTIAPKQRSEAPKVYPKREQINRPNRTYRIGELVWCIIEPNILDGDTLVSIDQWPGLIEAHRVKKAVLSGDSIMEDEFYHVKLLALKDSFVLPGSRLTPYKGFKPTPALISLIQSLPPPPTLKLASQIYHFHQNVSYLPVQHQEDELEPCADLFLQATGPYALALQNAARLALTWGFSYPQIKRSESETWYRNPNMTFAGLWWGSELIYVGEMAILIVSRAQLSQHPTTMAYVQCNQGEDDRAVILQITNIQARSSVDKVPGESRAFLTGVLYELVPLLSDTAPDPVSTMPKQTAPLGMMWKQLIPPVVEGPVPPVVPAVEKPVPIPVEVCVDVTLLSGRYYEDGGALPAEQMQKRSMVASVLQGLAHGQYNRGNTPSSYHNTRGQMCRAAKKDAIQDLEQYWSGRIELT